MTRSDRIGIFCDEIWTWYSQHKRTLPWRDLNEKDLDHKAYLILVSEVMLQQTQVSRVIILYKYFIQLFPHIEDLSKASNRDVIMAWRGLGYNNRALRLRDAAREIMRRGGKFPRDMKELQELPGVGHYTASAIRNFSFGIPTACIDVNVRRILHRFFVGPENPDGTWKKDDRYLLELAEKVLVIALNVGEVGVVRNTSDWHAALMDFGSLVCTKNNPKWDLMSTKMKSICMAYGKDIIRTKKVNKTEPGRMMAGKFVPNRIFRGKIVEVLRSADTGLTLEDLGHAAIADWPVLSEANGMMGDHRMWLVTLIESLKKDCLIEKVKGKWQLKE